MSERTRELLGQLIAQASRFLAGSRGKADGDRFASRVIDICREIINTDGEILGDVDETSH